MNRLISRLFAFCTKSRQAGVSASRSRQARLQVECLEGRELMSASPIAPTASSLGPKSLLIYYGYPSLINGAQTLSQAASTMGAYADVVLGDGIEDPTHPDHANTALILSDPAMAHTMVFGYVDLGVSTQNLTIAQMETRIDQWKSTGAKGIFLDDFGYDFNTTRARQNTIVAYAHSDGLVVTANAFNPADAFGSQVDALHNPTGAATALNAGDFYLYEDYQIIEGTYVSASDWQAKASQLATYQSTIGFQVLAETTNSAANVFDQNQFNYAWYSALQAGYAAVGWGEYDYAASTCQAPERPTPTVAAGTAFTSAIVQNGAVFTRNTDLGQIVVNTTTHTGSFGPLLNAPSFTAKVASATQINLSWKGVSGVTGYAVDELISGSWKQIASLGATSFSDAVTGLAGGTSYSFKVAATNGTSTVFAAPQTVETLVHAPTLKASAISTTQINLTWTKETGATSYLVEEWIAGKWRSIRTVSASSSSLSIHGLHARSTYYFIVAAHDASGWEFSNHVGIRTK